MEETQNPYAAPSAPPPLPSELGESVKADRGIRLVARLIDWGLQMVFLVPAVVGMLLLSPPNSNPGQPNDFTPAQMAVLGVGVLLALGLAVYQLVLLYQTQQTLGKRWMNIKIVRNDDSQCSFGRIFGLRMVLVAVIEQVPCLGALFALANVLWIFSEDSRCLHDLLADTKVVNV
ncbi:RDD family protein [Pseudomonas sp. CGJS7]|uniref:RDD family protein n=1 Tax=Pseudomonas sp. CGJS7 TaxID=3109348 RepID=UPI00300B5B52